MKRGLLIFVILAALLLSACGAPATTPVPTATLAPTPTPKADPEREDIITFTRQALEIEAKRNELMAYFASLRDKFGSLVPGFAMKRSFLKGVRAGEYSWAPETHDLAGMSALLNRLLLLDCPQGLQAIKDSLSYIYASEIEQFRREKALSSLTASYGFSFLFQLEGSKLPEINISADINPIYPEVTKDNLDYWKQMADASGSAALRGVYLQKIEGQWGELQSLRRDTYIRWAQILQEHGIDLSKEGFTALAPTPTPIPPLLDMSGSPMLMASCD